MFGSTIAQAHVKTGLIKWTNTKGSGETAHPHSLVRAITFCTNNKWSSRKFQKESQRSGPPDGCAGALSHVVRKPGFRVCNQVILKLACSVTEAISSLEILDIASICIKLSRQRTTKVLIRLRGCYCSHMA